MQLLGVLPRDGGGCAYLLRTRLRGRARLLRTVPPSWTPSGSAALSGLRAHRTRALRRSAQDPLPAPRRRRRLGRCAGSEEYSDSSTCDPGLGSVSGRHAGTRPCPPILCAEPGGVGDTQLPRAGRREVPVGGDHVGRAVAAEVAGLIERAARPATRSPPATSARRHSNQVLDRILRRCSARSHLRPKSRTDWSLGQTSGVVLADELRRLGRTLRETRLPERCRHLGVRGEALPVRLVPVEDRPNPVALIWISKTSTLATVCFRFSAP